jgi:ELWxxDGT repeat protein
MPRDSSKRTGPPEKVLDKLVEIHGANGTLDNVLNSAIGDKLEPRIQTQTAFLAGFTPDQGTEIWSYQGGATVYPVADIFLGTGSSNTAALGSAELDGDLYFTAFDPIHGFELRVLDGATGTISLVADISSGSSSSEAGIYSGLVEFDGDLYFTAYDPTNGYELRVLDSDTGMVSLVEDINGGSGSSNAGIYSGLVEFDGDLYFTAYDPTNGYELRVLDSDTGTVSLVTDINDGPDGSDAGIYSGLVALDGNLYFTAYDPVNGYELRALDGDTGAVSLVADINVGSGSSDAAILSGLVAVDGNLYFTAYEPTAGYELHMLEISTGTVSLVEDINSGSGTSDAGVYSGLVAFNDDLFFAAYDPTNGYELRVLDTDTGAVSIVADINGGSGSSIVGNPDCFEFNGDLYFTAFDPANGVELRVLDGKTGTVDTFDFAPGSASSAARVLGAVNDHLVIAALIDRDGDGDYDDLAMLASAGEPASAADFEIVDDGSGTFEPVNLFHVSDVFFEA